MRANKDTVKMKQVNVIACGQGEIGFIAKSNAMSLFDKDL